MGKGAWWRQAWRGRPPLIGLREVWCSARSQDVVNSGTKKAAETGTTRIQISGSARARDEG